MTGSKCSLVSDVIVPPCVRCHPYEHAITHCNYNYNQIVTSSVVFIKGFEDLQLQILTEESLQTNEKGFENSSEDGR